MPLFGTISIWVALGALLVSLGCYLAGKTQAGRAAFCLAALAVLCTAGALGTLLVTHRFDVQYVYDHSARAMSPLYYFPSFWAGQEGSFLLWAFWISILGVVLACTAGAAERRVMPIYGTVLLFLVAMLVLKPPFVHTADEFGNLVTPTEGLGLNPNLENPWMVIHPPTLFLGFSALTVPFAFALSALFWRDWDGWLRRALPWGLFGFSVLGLAMMMGGYWAYEMLGWGGFWGWDPVENGPLIPWLTLIGFLHAAQIQRVRDGFQKPTLVFALLPFLAALYETFLTRTGVLDQFSVHSFSTLGGAANNVLLGVLLFAVAVSIGMLLFRSRRLAPPELGAGGQILQEPTSREFGYVLAILLLTLCAVIALVGMSAPLLTTLGMKLGLATHVGTVKEDFYNQVLFPFGILLAVGMGLGPYLAWRGKGGESNAMPLLWSYGLAVAAAIGFWMAAFFLHTGLTGTRLAEELIFFAACMFALLANVQLLRRLFPSPHRPAMPWTIGGTLAHLGAVLFLLGVICLVTFVQKDPDVLLVQNQPTGVLNGQYIVTYLGQTGDWQTDKDNALRFGVVSRDGREKFTARLPFALRPLEDGEKKIFGHPAIVHHAGGDLYLALKDGPDEFYPNGRYPNIGIPLGSAKQIGNYKIQLVRFERDPKAAAMAQQGVMPDIFPVWADLRVAYGGKTTAVRPELIRYSPSYLAANPNAPSATDVPLPGGWRIALDSMNAGSADRNNPNAGAMSEQASFTMRPEGPVLTAFQLEVTTRPMINLVWIGTLVLFAGGLVSMRRRILENRAIPIPDLPSLSPPPGAVAPELGAGGRTSTRRRSKNRAPSAKPAPSLFVGKGRGD